MFPPITAAAFSLSAVAFLLLLRPTPGGSAPSSEKMPPEILIQRVVVAQTRLLISSMAALMMSASAYVLGILPDWVALPAALLAGYHTLDAAKDVVTFRTTEAAIAKQTGAPSHFQAHPGDRIGQLVLSAMALPAVVWAAIALLN